MKSIINLSILILWIGVLFHISCKKETSCEGCACKNKPPIAKAGLDQVITLPTDSVLLDGNSTSDPDGKISEWLWTKISGPVSFNIIRSSDSITKVKTLVAGTYQFELKVTDNCGLSAKDTVQVIVNDPSIPNRPPVANAGADQVITLPTNTITLNGNGSSDPDNNITSYLWKKISGPSSFNIANSNVVQTQVTNLVQGIYQFELKVTDAGGLFSKDTMQVIVNSSPPTTGCNLANRQEINVQLTQIGTLSEPKTGVAVGAVGDKIFFAGGINGDEAVYTIDIYDISLNNWTTAQLSVPRWLVVTATCGNKIFFAGGYNSDGMTFAAYYNTVDVYDASTNSWSVISLSEGKYNVAATSLGNKVFFAGGYLGSFQMSKKVEIYDILTNQWSYADLSQARESLTADAVGNKVYFAGGNTGYTVAPNALLAYPTDRIDVYNDQANSWSTETLSEPKWALASIAIENKIYWAGGITYASSIPGSASQKIDIKNTSPQSLSFDCLFQVNMFFKAVRTNNKIIFFTGNGGYGSVINKFDIYDISTSTWSIGVLPFNMEGTAIISVNNTIFLAGGYVNGVLSDKAWKLEF